MPHLVYCGRLWRFSSDELSIPSMCAAIWRVIWTAILCSIYVLAHRTLKNCNQKWIIMLYLIFSIFISIASILCEFCLAHVSLKGTMVNYQPRIQILNYLTIHIVFIICQLLCAIFGIYIVNYNTLPCVKDFRSEVILALLYVTIITQLIDISGLVCCWTLFSSRSVSLEDNFGRDIHLTRESSFTGTYPNSDANAQWSTRCKYLCKSVQCCTCNLIGGSGVREDLDAVGAVLSDFFHHEGFLDVVPSDVVAGILLLQFQQRSKMLADRELQIDHLKRKLIARNNNSPRNNGSGNVTRSYHKYPPKVAEAVQIVAEVLDGCVPADENFHDFMIRTKTQYLTALEILNQENFNIDLPPLESEDTEETRSFFAPSVDYDNDSRPQSIASNSRGLFNGHTGISNKSIGTSLSSKDLGSKNPSINSIRCSDEMMEGKIITPRSSIPPTLEPDFAEEINDIQLTEIKNITPKVSPHYTPLSMNRELPEEAYPSDIEAELADEFDEEGLPISFTEPFDPKVNRSDLKHCIATNFDEIEELAHFSHYALGIYSTLMFLYMNPCTGLCQLCHFCSCVYPMGHCNPINACIQTEKENTKISCSFRCLTNKSVIGDNSCHFHEAAIRKLSNFDSAELIYAQLSNNVSETPYAVFVDFDRKAVVITVRGTLSLEDCITDAMATPESLREAGMAWSFVGDGRYAHSGMLKSAMQIRNTLRDVQRVSELLDFVSGEHPTGGEVYRHIHKDLCPNIITPLNESYHINKLYVVGHSLGAGVASILGLLMKSEFPTLKILTYGTPGSIFDKRTAGDVSTFMTSCVFGNDLVASLSFHSLSHLRENVLDSIARSKVSKMAIMQTAMFQDDPDLDMLLYTKGLEPDSKFHTMVEKYKNHMRKKLKKRGHRRLYHPGRIIHLRQIGADLDSSCCPFPFRSKPKLYAPFITHMLSFTEIMISSSMVLDHLPDNYVNHLNKLVKEWEIERKTTHQKE